MSVAAKTQKSTRVSKAVREHALDMGRVLSEESSLRELSDYDVEPWELEKKATQRFQTTYKQELNRQKLADQSQPAPHYKVGQIWPGAATPDLLEED